MTPHDGRGCPPAPRSLDLATLAHDRLRQTRDHALAALRCDEHDGILCLSGRVPTRDGLLRAIAAVSGLPGLRGLDNRVAVGPAATP
jgi:hypothetical protein